MSAAKLSSDEVPHKFSEWLLGMGCPADKVPSLEKVSQMCRGQYYMVWRSLMEHVHPKDEITQKRLYVFCDDVKTCEQNSVFNKYPDTVVPNELVLWQQQKELGDKVLEAENRVAHIQDNLNQLINKISNKMSQRNVSRRRVEDLQRRVWLLRAVCEELSSKKENLEETKTIANSLCYVASEDDVQNKLDKCLSAICKSSQSCTPQLTGNPVASSSIMSTHNEQQDPDEHLASLSGCSGDALWPKLLERRASLVDALPLSTNNVPAQHHRQNPQSVLAHTAALHCSLALEAMKNKVHIKQTRTKLASSLEDLNNYMSGEACELLVLRCERARSEARLNALRSLLGDVTSRAGLFCVDAAHSDARALYTKIHALDTSIETARDELKRLISSLALTERKIYNARECLTTVFSGLHNNTQFAENERCRGVQLDFPQESISILRQFYDEGREKRRNKAELSLNLDLSECSFNDTVENASPKFVNELKMYLKKFDLEKNRKVILESGEKNWIFETINACVQRAYTQDLSLVCPSVSVTANLRRIADDVAAVKCLELVERELREEKTMGVVRDITTQSEEEAQTADKIKKRTAENLTALEKSNRTLELGRDNLRFWRDDLVKKYISGNRTVDAKTYREYEALYMESLSLKA